MALPCQGHLEVALHVLSNLSLHMDPTQPEVDSDQMFQICEWSEFYGEVKEPALRKEFDLGMFVDNHHTGDECMCRSYWLSYIP